MMKSANEIAKITETAIDKRAREFIMNTFAPIIIKRAEEGRKDASVDLIKSGMDYSMACMVGAKIKSILENEFDYVVEFINGSNHYDETAYICAQWGYALK